MMSVSSVYQSAVKSLSDSQNGRIEFAVIGAMDGVNHDPLSRLISENKTWTGILVEPVHDMFQKLCTHYAGRTNLIFENCAIGDKAGDALITRVPIDAIGDKWPAWLDGCSTLTPASHLISNYANISVKENITVSKLVDVFQKHGINNVDVFQSDTEGHDKIIFDQLWKSGIRPKILFMEIKYMTSSELEMVETLLHINGYACARDTEDMVAIR